MRIGRTIIAALVGLSVAILPAASSFAMAGAAAAEMSASHTSASHTMPDCDHHRTAPSAPAEKTAGDCPCMAACASNSISFTAPEFSGVVFSPPAGAVLKPAPARIDFSSLMGSPPFRPPRV